MTDPGGRDKQEPGSLSTSEKFVAKAAYGWPGSTMSSVTLASYTVLKHAREPLQLPSQSYLQSLGGEICVIFRHRSALAGASARM